MHRKKRKNLIMVLVVLGVSIMLIFLSFIFSKSNNFFENILRDSGLFISNIYSSLFNDNQNYSCDDSINKELQYQFQYKILTFFVFYCSIS